MGKDLPTTRLMDEAQMVALSKAMGGIDYRVMPPEWFDAQIDRIEAEEANDEQKRLDSIWRATELAARGS